MTAVDTIPLDQFLKLQGVVESGGHAKLLIRDGQVRVNGLIETRRGRKLRRGDIVELGGEQYRVEPRAADLDET